jgi:hypothetical protein
VGGSNQTSGDGASTSSRAAGDVDEETRSLVERWGAEDGREWKETTGGAEPSRRRRRRKFSRFFLHGCGI